MIYNGMWDVEEAASETGRHPQTIQTYIYARKLVPDDSYKRMPLFKPETITQFFKDRRAGRKPSASPRGYCSVKELATILDRSEFMIRYYIRVGTLIPDLKDDKQMFFERQSVEVLRSQIYLRKHRHGRGSKAKSGI